MRKAELERQEVHQQSLEVVRAVPEDSVAAAEDSVAAPEDSSGGKVSAPVVKPVVAETYPPVIEVDYDPVSSEEESK